MSIRHMAKTELRGRVLSRYVHTRNGSYTIRWRVVGFDRRTRWITGGVELERLDDNSESEPRGYHQIVTQHWLANMERAGYRVEPEEPLTSPELKELL